MLQKWVSRNADGPGIHEGYITNQRKAYQTFRESKVASGGKKPLWIGVLIFDKTKFSRMLFQVQSKVVWNSMNSTIKGYAMMHDITMMYSWV